MLRFFVGFLGCFLYFLPVLVRAGEVEDVVPLQVVPAGEEVGDDFLVCVPDVWRRVRVIDGRCYVVCLFGHAWMA